MKRIRQVIFAVLALAAIGILAHGTAQRDEPLPPGFVRVTYWEKWTGAEGQQMRQIVDDFNRTVGREKGIYVDYMSMSNIDQKVLIATSAGVPPDIAGLWDQQVAQYAALDAVEPLDELAAAHGITEETYLPVYWNGCRYNGRLYALVSTPAAIALHYNREIFEEHADALRAAGCDPDRPPRTIEELDRYAEVLEKRSPAGYLERAGYLPLQSWYVPFTPYWFGGRIFDPETGRFELTSEATIAAYRWIQGYARRIGPSAMQDFSSAHPMSTFDSPQNPFLTGNLIMQQQGPWMANYVRNLKPSMSQRLVPTEQEHTLPRRTDNYAWAVAPFPAGVPGLENVTFCSFDVLMIPKGARHKAEAFEFIAYVNRQDVTEKLNRLHCKNSPLRQVSEDFLNNHPNPYIRVFQELAASPNAHGVPPVPIWPQVARELNNAAQAVALQGADPETVLRAAEKRLQAQFDRFVAIEQRRAQSKSAAEGGH